MPERIQPKDAAPGETGPDYGHILSTDPAPPSPLKKHIAPTSCKPLSPPPIKVAAAPFGEAEAPDLARPRGTAVLHAYRTSSQDELAEDAPLTPEIARRSLLASISPDVTSLADTDAASGGEADLGSGTGTASASCASSDSGSDVDCHAADCEGLDAERATTVAQEAAEELAEDMGAASSVELAVDAAQELACATKEDVQAAEETASATNVAADAGEETAEADDKAEVAEIAKEDATNAVPDAGPAARGMLEAEPEGDVPLESGAGAAELVPAEATSAGSLEGTLHVGAQAGPCAGGSEAVAESAGTGHQVLHQSGPPVEGAWEKLKGEPDEGAMREASADSVRDAEATRLESAAAGAAVGGAVGDARNVVLTMERLDREERDDRDEGACDRKSCDVTPPSTPPARPKATGAGREITLAQIFFLPKASFVSSDLCFLFFCVLPGSGDIDKWLGHFPAFPFSWLDRPGSNRYCAVTPGV